MDYLNFRRTFSFKIEFALIVAVVIMVAPMMVFARPASEPTPFGPAAPWNVPVAGLAKDPNSGTLSAHMYNYAPDRPGNFNLVFTDYTYPVYYVQDSTANYTVHGGNSTINGKLVPWNPAWRAAAGSDAQVIVLDPTTGREWDLWQVSVSGTTVNVSNGSLIGADEDVGGAVGDYRSKINSWRPSRGCGIEYLAMLVRPEEVAQGEIRHALSMPVANTVAGLFVRPATKSDLTGIHSANPVPQGARFALNVTDAQIDVWAATKPAAYQKLARVVAHALQRYGWFVTDHSGAAGWQFEGITSADALWRAQGVDAGTSSSPNWSVVNLMDGLITASNIYALAPPPYSVTSPPVPPPPTPCTAAETAVCETQYNACMAACNQ